MNKNVGKKSYFMEKNKIYRMLSMAMVEDGIVKDDEKQIMITIILRRYLEDSIKGDFIDYCKEYHNISWEEVHNIELKDGDGEFVPNSLYSLEYLYKNVPHKITINNSAYKWLIYYRILGDNGVIASRCKEKNPNKYKQLLNLKNKIASHFPNSHNVWCDIINSIIENNNEPNIKDCDETSKSVVIKAFDFLKNSYKDVLKEQAKVYTKICIMAHMCLNNSEKDLVDAGSPASRSQFAEIDRLDKEEKIQELIDLYAIIFSDRVIMDSEREAFRVICKLFKFRHSSLILQAMVKLYTDVKIEALLIDYQNLYFFAGRTKWLINIEKYLFYFKKRPEWLIIDSDPNTEESEKYKYNFFYFSEKTKYDVNDYTYIKEAIIKYEIKGPLKYGVCQTFTRDIMSNKEKTWKFDRKWSKIAITIFAITALILYAFVSDLLLSNSPMFESENFNLNIFKDNNGDSPFMMLMISISSLVIFLICCFISIRERWEKRTKFRKLKHDLLSYPRYPNKNIWRVFFTSVSLVLLACMTFEVSFEGLKTLFIPIVLLLMMLSIEWLIFMKAESKENNDDVNSSPSNSKKEHDNTPLYVLTFVAILLDMGLGAVEWLLDNEDYKILLAKLSSAIVLGAICYFSGKFLEMHRAQQKYDRETMDKCVKEIKNGKES